jgi:hypothetical protein
VLAVDPKRVTQLLPDLGSKESAVRQKAYAALVRLGEAAAPALREAAKKPPSAEAARQLKSLLEGIERRREMPSGQRLAALRALEVLERIGDRAATAVLTRLAEGSPGAQVTEEARRSLERLEKKGEDPE